MTLKIIERTFKLIPSLYAINQGDMLAECHSSKVKSYF